MITRVIVLFSLSGLTLSQTTTIPVTTENGPVVGTSYQISNQKINKFLGIPYARAPLGNLRFKKPEPSANWSVNYEANIVKPACMQPSYCLTYTSEDCLYLNIFTPSLNTSANLSVMLWIHGGAFSCYSGYDYDDVNNFDGSQLALRNVVIVTINYRLGVFGFLYGNSSEAPGNAGLWDQVMALNWTHRNIANFGGNPNDITLFGQSAGSISISDLIVSNQTIGAINWFRKAILMSGSGYNVQATQRTNYAYSLARTYASNAFILPWDVCTDDQTWIACLKSKTANELITAQMFLLLFLFDRPAKEIVQFAPIFGDELIPISPNSAVKTGYFRHDIKLLLSHTEMEAELFAGSTVYGVINVLGLRYYPYVDRPLIFDKALVRHDITNVLFANIPFGQTVADAYTKKFNELSVALNPQPIRRSAIYASGDYSFGCPTILFGGYIAKYPLFTGKVYQSKLTYANSKSPVSGSKWANVTHGDDVPLLFGAPISGPLINMIPKSILPSINLDSDWTSDDVFLSNKIMDYYTHFAKTGEMPTVNLVYGVWPSYTVNNGHVNACYVELHADTNRLGRVYYDRYRGNDGYTPSVINNCFNFWDPLINSQFN